MNAKTTTHGGGATAESQLEQVRARIRAAGGAAEQARRSAAAANQLASEVELLRRRLPVVAAAAQRANHSARALQGRYPRSIWFALRGRLAVERARRSALVQSALAERWVLTSRIAEQEAEARALREEAARLRSAAAALPRLLDEAATCVRGMGGTEAETLLAAEGGLEPVLRREADLDHAVRWTRWAQAHVSAALDRLGPARTFTTYDFFRYDTAFLPAGPNGAPSTGGLAAGLPAGAAGTPGERAAAARAALGGVRDVLAVLVQALTDLGVGMDEVAVPSIPDDLGEWFDDLDGPASPARQAVADALTGSELVAVQLAALGERIGADRAATRAVLQARRAQWCSILRGA